MRLYYYRDPLGNFGDDLNPWLWARLLPDVVDVERPVLHPSSREIASSEGPLFIGIGTLLNTNVPAAPQKVVFGSGTGYKEPAHVDANWKVYFVRGPMTAEALGLEPHLAVADPALLIRNFEWPTDKTYRCSYVPHHNSIKSGRGIDWGALCQNLGVHMIDPTHSPEDVITQVAQSEAVITESLHGAIVADALRVPWCPVNFHEGINSFKWEDWCQSVGVAHEPAVSPRKIDLHPRRSVLQPVDGLLRKSLTRRAFEKAVASPQWTLSSDARMQELIDRLNEKIDEIRRDHLRET